MHFGRTELCGNPARFEDTACVMMAVEVAGFLRLGVTCPDPNRVAAKAKGRRMLFLVLSKLQGL